jgi:hypothetical protein
MYGLTTQQEGRGIDRSSDETAAQLHLELYELFQELLVRQPDDDVWKYVDADLVDHLRGMLKAQ